MLSIVTVALVVLVLDGIVSMSEAAFFSIPYNRVRLLAEKKQTRAVKTLLNLKEKNEVPITTLVSLSNIITITGSVIIGALVDRNYGSGWLGAFSALLTFLVMIFAEIIPKKFGERHAQIIATVTAPALQIISSAFTPVIWFVNKVAKPIAYRQRLMTTSEEEISFLARVGSREGSIEEGESQFIQRIFKLNDITAEDIMTPRPRVLFIDGNQTLADAREEIIFSQHSRLPVFDGTRDNVIGVVHQKNLLRALSEGKDKHIIRDFMEPLFCVPESQKADDLLRDFQKKKIKLAAVIDEHESFIGVVAIEDIIEELVGQSIDEREVIPETIKRVSKSEIVVHGQTKVEALNTFFNSNIHSKKTINGYLIGKFGHIPRSGESLEVEGLKFITESASAKSIEKVRVQKIQMAQTTDTVKNN